MKLENKDCIEYLKKIKSESVDLCVTDPPYNLSISNANHTKDDNKWDSFKSEKDFSEFTAKWLNEIYRILKPNGTCWFFFAPSKIHSIFEAVNQTKFFNNLENWTIFARDSGRGSKHKLKSLREDIFHLVKDPDNYTWNETTFLRKVIAPYMMAGGAKRGWDHLSETDDTPVRWTGTSNVMAFCSDYDLSPKQKKRGTVLDMASGLPMIYDGLPSDVTFYSCPSYNNKFEKQIHVAQKPLLLVSMLVMMSSKENETIIDPFMGSGTTGIVCKLSNRDFIGIEREKDMFDKAKKRIDTIDYAEAEKYIKWHLSTSEEGSKFSFGSRYVMPKS